MTAYGFDLDGTLDRPELAQLANDLHDAGHEVYVITGGLSDSGEWTVPERKRKLARLGVRYTEIVRCIDSRPWVIGQMKGTACEQRGIGVLFDDSAGYLKGAAETGSVVRLLVLP